MTRTQPRGGANPSTERWAIALENQRYQTANYLALTRWAAWLLAVVIVIVNVSSGDETIGEPWLLIVTFALTLALTVAPIASRLRSAVADLLPEGVDELFVIGLADLVIALLILFASGGWSSPYYAYALVALLQPASVVGPRALGVLAVLFIGGYVLGLAAETDSIHEPWAGGSVGNFVFFLAVPVPVAILVNQLSSTARRLSAEETKTRDLLEENVRLDAARQRAAVDEERHRIAREIHDGIAQSMYMLSLNLEAARESAGADSELGERIGLLVHLSKQMLIEIRQYIFDLKPLLSGEEHVSAVLRKQAEEFATISGIPVSVDVQGLEVSLPISHGAALYRIAQEALANTYRHANASEIEISLTYGPQEVRLRVKDDGIGFDARQSGGMGLGHISERVRELGGQMTVEAAPGKGVILGATLPVSHTQ